MKPIPAEAWDVAVRYSAAIHTRAARGMWLSPRSRKSRTDDRVAPLCDVVQNALIALARNLTSRPGRVSRKMIRWAVGHGFRKRNFAVWPIGVPSTRAKDSDATKSAKAAVRRPLAWFDVHEVEVVGNAPDPAQVVEDLDSVRHLLERMPTADMALVIRYSSGVTLKSMAAENGVSVQAMSIRLAKARRIAVMILS